MVKVSVQLWESQMQKAQKRESQMRLPFCE